MLSSVWLAQDISAAEEEAAKKKVGGAAAVKQLEKLRKEAAKTSKDAERTAEELASRKEEHKVSHSPYLNSISTNLQSVEGRKPAASLLGVCHLCRKCRKSLQIMSGPQAAS